MQTFNTYLIRAMFGWMVLGGTLHFIADVVSQHLRGKRVPGVETMLYYGLHNSFALGQVAFGLLGLLIARRAMPLLQELPVLVLCVVVSLGWLAVAVGFIEYWQPKANAALLCALALAVLFTRS
ncbi:MAG: hypothetical protein IBJ03_06025 [Gemmatimonadaceae bacterium]|nr:hypothetical protein [Gemmatimonadaceae bacterium]